MSCSADELYSVVNKSKNALQQSQGASFQQPQEYEAPVASYSVLENYAALKPALQTSAKPDIPSVVAISSSQATVGNIYTNAAEFGAITSNTALYNSAASPTYSRLEQSHQVPPISQQKSLVREPSNMVSHDTIQKFINVNGGGKKYSLPICLLFGFTLLLVIVVVNVLVLIVAFVQISRLRSDLNEVTPIVNSEQTKNMELSEANISHLIRDVQQFMAGVESVLLNLKKDVSKNITLVDTEFSNASLILKNVLNTQGNIESELEILSRRFYRTIGEVNMSIYSSFFDFESESSQMISDILGSSQNSVNSLMTSLLRDIQVHHVFDSCASVSSSSLPFPSGLYHIHTPSGSSVQAYCSMTLTCGSLTGGWRRVAYLNVSNRDGNDCPGGFNIRSNPLSCRRSSSSAGCSPVTYETNGISYSQVCGTVVAQGVGSPDGFRNGNIDWTYVDGISLTYGSPRNHLWSYPVLHNGNCNDCMNRKPGFVSSHFYCFSPDCSSGMVCSESGCSENWFYRRFEDSVTNSDVELRVCRDQVRNNEDIYLNHVEIYVQ